MFPPHSQASCGADEASAYRGVGWHFKRHDFVNQGHDEYVRGDAHTNTVEGFFSILKRGLYGVYQHVSEAHLHRYLAEFDFRYNNRAKLGNDDTTRTNIAIQGAAAKRLTRGLLMLLLLQHYRWPFLRSSSRTPP